MSAEYEAVPLTDLESGSPSHSQDPSLLPVTLYQVSKPKRTLHVLPSLTVRALKHEAYPDEVAASKRIRFIHSGRVLADELVLGECLLQSQFIHVAISAEPDTSQRRRRSSAERQSVEDDDEDQEAADRRLALMLSEREEGVLGADTEFLEPVEVPEGDARDFFWGFILASLFGYIMVIFMWQPRIPRRQKLGILCGMMFFIMNGLARTTSQASGSGSE